MTTNTLKTSDRTATSGQTNGILAPISALFAAIAKRREEKRNHAYLIRDLTYLREQTDHMLQDIGLTQKQLWDDGIGLDTLKSGRI
jgi:uncharacterized protein YjiS (DUF1127 family)